MPPRGRSSGSRSRSSSSRSSSSRSRSSSRSSSSRSRSSSSSSRSRSSSSISRSSGPSSRSIRHTTSHSSSYSPSYGSSYTHSRPTTRRVQKTRSKTDRKAIIFARNYKKPIRTKPTFVINNTKVKPIFHHCYKHDYYYYSSDFYDETTNVHYKKGYYDEDGTYYEDLNLKYSETEIIEIVECEYCGSSEKIDLKNAKIGETFKCSNCNALLNLDNITELNTDYYVCDENDNFPNEQIETYYEDEPYNGYSNSYSNSSNNYSTNTSSSNKGIGIITGFVCFFLFICCFPCFLGTLDNSSFDNDYSYNEEDYYYDYDYDNDYDDNYYEDEDDYNTSYENFYDYEIFGDNLYVPEIDRTCYFDGDYYYDSVTDCYFYYNTDVSPAQMTYWYEDFSSQYGDDYGWIEYDENDGNWYVEVDYGEWEVVDNPPSYFWYTSFDSLLTGNDITFNDTNYDENNYVYNYDNVELGSTIYISEIDRYCSLDGEDYYDSETDCYFYIDYDNETPIVLYWYEDFSSEYGDYGWLDYDERDGNWYVEVDYDEWEIVDNPPDYFWHTSYESICQSNNALNYNDIIEETNAGTWNGEF